MEAAERSELDSTIKLMRGELKQARLYLEMDSLESGAVVPGISCS